MAVNFNEAIEREVSRISQKEQILGITLNQPFVGSNSGSRKSCITFKLNRLYHC